jgi:SAM-dependent methyltransferase
MIRAANIARVRTMERFRVEEAIAHNGLAQWEREYTELKSIPSSLRTFPSKALLLIEPLIGLNQSYKVFDAGCGNGRNCVYLAPKVGSVIAADFSPAALKAASALASNQGCIGRVLTTRINLQCPLPFEDDAFDLCLDSYVSCHFHQKKHFKNYWSELSRVTRPGGHIFSTMLANDDEYYSAIARGRRDGVSSVTDPINGITKQLYSEGEFVSLFSEPLSIQYFLKFQFSDVVLGRSVRRSLLVALLTKAK